MGSGRRTASGRDCPRTSPKTSLRSTSVRWLMASQSVPAVYRDPEHFFRVSYLTKGLRSLLEDVLSRLSDGAGNRVLKLLTPFGGGKSHTLASLFHAARNRKALDVLPEAQGLPRPANVRTAVFDGQFFDATKGKEIPGEKFRAQTMWGWIAWSLGGKKGYEIMREQDEARVAPGADEIIGTARGRPKPDPARRGSAIPHQRRRRKDSSDNAAR